VVFALKSVGGATQVFSVNQNFKMQILVKNTFLGFGGNFFLKITLSKIIRLRGLT